MADGVRPTQVTLGVVDAFDFDPPGRLTQISEGAIVPHDYDPPFRVTQLVVQAFVSSVPPTPPPNPPYVFPPCEDWIDTPVVGGADTLPPPDFTFPPCDD